MEGDPFKKQSPSLEVTIGNMVLTLTYMNTCLYGFKNGYQQDGIWDYSHLNKVLHMDGDGDLLHLYEQPEVYEACLEAGFPVVIRPYPEESDIDEYVQWWGSDIPTSSQDFMGEEE